MSIYPSWLASKLRHPFARKPFFAEITVDGHYFRCVAPTEAEAARGVNGMVLEHWVRETAGEMGMVDGCLQDEPNAK